MLGILGIVLALALLMALAYRGISILVLGPLLAMLAVVFAEGVPLLASYTQVFMAGLGRFIVQYFPLFLLGAIFGKLMDDAGAARTIAHAIVTRLGAQNAVLAIVLACGVLTYGGVSLFVVAFAVYPIAAALFRKADIPKRLIPAAIALGAFTFTMTALPGTPAIQNAIPMPFFLTTPFAAPGLGLIGGAIMLVLGAAWLRRRTIAARRNGEGYGIQGLSEPVPSSPHQLRATAQSEGFDPAELEAGGHRGAARPRGIWLALLPIITVIGVNYLFAEILIPRWDTAYLAQPLYGHASAEQLRGIWAVILALLAAILLVMVLYRDAFASLKQSLEAGANAAVLPIFNTASQVGFGAVIAALPAFAAIRDAVLGIAPNNPLISLSIAVNLLAGITGSASGGMSIALQALGETYMQRAAAVGISPELLHRVTAIATGGLDALPHNGAVITLLAICGLTHRESYGDIFIVAVAIPLMGLAVVVGLGTLFGSF